MDDNDPSVAEVTPQSEKKSTFFTRLFMEKPRSRALTKPENTLHGGQIRAIFAPPWPADANFQTYEHKEDYSSVGPGERSWSPLNSGYTAYPPSTPFSSLGASSGDYYNPDIWEIPERIRAIVAKGLPSRSAAHKAYDHVDQGWIGGRRGRVAPWERNDVVDAIGLRNAQKIVVMAQVAMEAYSIRLSTEDRFLQQSTSLHTMGVLKKDSSIREPERSPSHLPRGPNLIQELFGDDKDFEDPTVMGRSTFRNIYQCQKEDTLPTRLNVQPPSSQRPRQILSFIARIIDSNALNHKYSTLRNLLLPVNYLTFKESLSRQQSKQKTPRSIGYILIRQISNLIASVFTTVTQAFPLMMLANPVSRYRTGLGLRQSHDAILPLQSSEYSDQATRITLEMHYICPFSVMGNDSVNDCKKIHRANLVGIREHIKRNHGKSLEARGISLKEIRDETCKTWIDIFQICSQSPNPSPTSPYVLIDMSEHGRRKTPITREHFENVFIQQAGLDLDSIYIYIRDFSLQSLVELEGDENILRFTRRRSSSKEMEVASLTNIPADYTQAMAPMATSPLNTAIGKRGVTFEDSAKYIDSLISDMTTAELRKISKLVRLRIQKRMKPYGGKIRKSLSSGIASQATYAQIESSPGYSNYDLVQSSDDLQTISFEALFQPFLAEPQFEDSSPEFVMDFETWNAYESELRI